MSFDAESLRRKIRAVCVKNWPRPEGAESVKEIFHYCDATGLQGMVTSGHLWASDIFCLNDSSEVEYARQVICEALSPYGQLSSLKEDFLDERHFMDTYERWNTHVCCFSDEPDLLSQWRAYGAQGNGFAVGFNSQRLQEEGNRLPTRFAVLPIVYSRADQISALRRFLSETLDIEGLAALLESNPRDVMLAIGRELLWMMTPLKDLAFRDEREWRIVRIGHGKESLLFRSIRGAIVPYVEIPLKPECFTRIVQGPTSHKEFGERSLRMFLHQNGLDHVKVESSVIPLRSL